MKKKQAIKKAPMGWQPLFDNIEIGGELRLWLTDSLANNARRALTVYRRKDGNSQKRFATQKIFVITRTK